MKKNHFFTFVGTIVIALGIVSCTNDNGNYLLKNHVVFNRLPGEMYDMNMELVGTGDMDIYFTANKITTPALYK